MNSVDDFYLAKCRQPSDINEHLPTLKKYASECQKVTEFGVRNIVSTWALLAAKPKTLVSYDFESPGDHEISAAIDLAKKNGTDFTFILADVRTVDIEPTEMLFIDTYHSYEQLATELGRHSDKVSRYIVMHDTVTFGERGERPGEYGLNKAIQDFLVGDPQWTEKERFYNNHGLTVLVRR